MDLAARAGISVEYLTRIEQGRDRNPSIAVVNALADALSLSTAERAHLRYLAKISGGECTAHAHPGPVRRDVRASVLQTLRLLEPGVALVTNRLGDILAHTSGYEAVMRATGLLDAEDPNLTRFLFTDARGRTLFPDWEQVADEQTFALWLGPSFESHEWFISGLAPLAGPEFTERVNRHQVPGERTLRLNHPSGAELEFNRETLEISGDAQQLVVFLPADASTAGAVEHLRRQPARRLRAVS